MRLLPDILAERAAADGVEIDLRVPPDLAYFEGHFPGLPILPGVVQVDWSVKLARERFALPGDFAAAENLKFLSIVRPGACPTLSLALSAGRLAFSYRGPQGRISSGILVFR